jgi:hypothetical protein
VLDAVRRYLERLNRSFSACCRLLERPRAARRAVVGLLTIHTALLMYSAYVHSPTLNEPGHLVAGLFNWRFGRFDVYSVNPPLVRMVAALPVMAVGYEENWSGFYAGPGARPEFVMGEDFVAANGERSFFLFMIARWACIPFSWIGAITCYLWARDLYGRTAGIVACSLWCLEPNILAHASLITADAAGAALGVAACYTFWRWLKRPTWLQAALTGTVLGLAELTKTTLILFYPIWPVMWVGYRVMEGRTKRRDPSFGETRQRLASLSETRIRVSEKRGNMWLREAGMLALRMAIGLYVLNLGYGFEGSLKPLQEFQFVSDALSGGDANAKEAAGERVPFTPGSRFASTWVAGAPSPFPKNYLLGLDLQQRDFEHYGRLSYLCGQWRDHGWWHYYLYACAIKVPLGLWALGVFTVMAAARKWSVGSGGGPRHGSQELGFRNEESEIRSQESGSRSTAYGLQPKASFPDVFPLLLPPLVIFIVVSSKTGINEHIRYVLPSFPFAFIGLSCVFRNFVDKAPGARIDCPQPQRFRLHRAACPFLVTLLLWSVCSSAWIYPHSLSYFNESIGGPLYGPRHLLGSNVDWGQDLRYLDQWFEREAKAGDLIVVRLAGSQLIIQRLSATARIGLKSAEFIAMLDSPRVDARPVLLGVSAMLLHNSPWKWELLAEETLKRQRNLFGELRRRTPLTHVGYTSTVYRLRVDELAN